MYLSIPFLFVTRTFPLSAATTLQTTRVKRYNKSLMLPTFLPICHLCPPCSIRPAETNILCLLLNRTNYRMRTDWRIFFEIKP